MVEGLIGIITIGITIFLIWSNHKKKQEPKIEDFYSQDNSPINLTEVKEQNPDIQQVIIKDVRGIDFQKFKTIKYTSKKRDYSLDLEKYMKLGITPHIFAESLLPVYLGGRKASCCFADQINFQSSIEQLEMIAKNLKEDYNILMDAIAIPLNKGCLITFFFFKDNKEYNRIEELQKLSENKLDVMNNNTFRNPKLVRLWGEILGYPKCCIDFFVKTREENKEVEDECSDMLKAILENKKTTSKENTKEENKVSFPKDILTSYFSHEFYPCKPGCNEAKKIGENIKQLLSEDKATSGSFSMILDFNIKKVLNPNMDPKLGKFQSMMKDKVIQRVFSVYKESGK